MFDPTPATTPRLANSAGEIATRGMMEWLPMHLVEVLAGRSPAHSALVGGSAVSEALTA